MPSSSITVCGSNAPSSEIASDSDELEEDAAEDLDELACEMVEEDDSELIDDTRDEDIEDLTDDDNDDLDEMVWLDDFEEADEELLSSPPPPPQATIKLQVAAIRLCKPRSFHCENRVLWCVVIIILQHEK